MKTDVFKLVERLKKLAGEKTRQDMINDGEADYESFYCGNEDDAYSDGMRDGEINLAREVLSAMGEKY